MIPRIVSRHVFCPRAGFSTLSSSHHRQSTAPQDAGQPLVDFSNAREALKSKTTFELVKSYLIYSLFKYDVFVDNSSKVMKTARKLLGPSLFSKIMKSTFYGQFAAGETDRDVMDLFARFRSVGVRCTLNYSVEEDENEADNHQRNVGSAKSFNDVNRDILLNSIQLTGKMSENDDGMIAIKLTGLCPTPLLSLLNQCVVGSERVFSLLADKPSMIEGTVNRDSFTRGLERIGISNAQAVDLWDELSRQKHVLNVFDWINGFQPHTDLFKTLSSTNACSEFLPHLSQQELSDLDDAITRIDSLGQCALDCKVKLLIDAEQTYFQSAIRHMTLNHLMPKYNRSTAVVHDTFQCYLKDSKRNLLLSLHQATLGGFHYGVKLVRGAYIEQERQLAAEKGYSSPIWDTKDDTNANYYELLQIMLDRITNTPRDSIVVGSHNEDTLLFAMEKMQELGISGSSGRVVFGQTMGMADHLALATAASGYMGYKFMPYGPVEEVLPYLSRRARENRGMLMGPVRERRILMKEIKRRLTEEQS